VVILFIVSWFMRRASPGAPTMTAMMLGWIGIVLALFAGWLGGELVYRLDNGAGVRARFEADLTPTHESTAQPTAND